MSKPSGFGEASYSEGGKPSSGKKPIGAMMDDIQFTPVLPPVDIPPGELYATHEGALDIPGVASFRCYQLSDGSRVIDADDVARFFGGAE